MILRSLCDVILRLGKKIAATFIDYSAAFDSISHKFLDAALEEAKVPNKLRAMFRAVYSAASAFTSVPAPDGKSAKSDCFRIRRGVVQGDITSPLFFILALEAILRLHDTTLHKGVSLGDTIIHILGYADDAALIDFGDSEGLKIAEERVSAIAKGSREDADMLISIPKTKVLHVRAQESVTATTGDEVRAITKFTCPHLHCGYKFHTRRGLKVHAGKCEWKNEFNIDRILESRGPTHHGEGTPTM